MVKKSKQIHILVAAILFVVLRLILGGCADM